MPHFLICPLCLMLLLSSTTLLLTAVALLAPAQSLVQRCDSLSDNVLTSVGCPMRCGANPCVIYAPSQSAQCQDHPSGAAGECYTQDGFIVRTGDTNETCSASFQCLDSLVDTTNTWLLSLSPSPYADNVTTAPVTRIQHISYPTSGVYTVQVNGGLGLNARGDLKNVKLDGSLFATPASVTSFYLSEMNLRNALASVDFSDRRWTRIAFNNANLKDVPTGLSELPLQYVELAKNFISTISDATPFQKVTTLNLAFNQLTDLAIDLPAIETLNLTGNPLAKIPDAVFAMRTLRSLSLRRCNLTNVVLTNAQFAFLHQIHTLDADFTTTSCPAGTAIQSLPTGAGSVCVPDTASLPVVNERDASNNTTVMVACVVVVVAMVVLLAVKLVRHKRHPMDPLTPDERGKQVGYTLSETKSTRTSVDSVWNDPVLLAVRIEYRDVEPIKLLSRGGAGEVWLGLYMNKNVAIKRLLTTKKTMNDALAFVAEVKIMARLDHPKIVRFIGAAWINALTIQAVSEFMDCGDLRSLLSSSRASSLTWANLKCQIAIDIADALVYMHTLNPKLIHRDLKSRNVLIDANTGAKLSDFGISRNRSVEESMTAGVGTARWMAPEVILSGHYTECADIYSFGVVLSELDTSRQPFYDAVHTNGARVPDITILHLVSSGKLQPTFTSSCPESIVKLAQACLSFDPNGRPSAIEIAAELRKILKDKL